MQKAQLYSEPNDTSVVEPVTSCIGCISSYRGIDPNRGSINLLANINTRESDTTYNLFFICFKKAARLVIKGRVKSDLKHLAVLFDESKCTHSSVNAQSPDSPPHHPPY